MNQINEYVCSCVRRIRIGQGLRIRDMADRTGIPLGSYSCLETGRYRMSLENLFRIIHVLGVDIAEVWPSLEGQRPSPVPQVTDEYIADVVEKAGERLPRQSSLEDILSAVSSIFGVTQQELSSPSRRRDLTQARTVAAILVKEENHLSLFSLSVVLNRDVSSLSHSMRRARERLPYDQVLRERIKRAREACQKPEDPQEEASNRLA